MESRQSQAGFRGRPGWGEDFSLRTPNHIASDRRVCKKNSYYQITFKKFNAKEINSKYSQIGHTSRNLTEGKISSME
jgi:hypothetical protein